MLGHTPPGGSTALARYQAERDLSAYYTNPPDRASSLLAQGLLRAGRAHGMGEHLIQHWIL